MPLTDAQRRAKAKYKTEKVKKILVEFYASDTDLWEKVQEQENKQGYIKALIKRDIQFHTETYDRFQSLHEERMEALKKLNYISKKDIEK